MKAITAMTSSDLTNSPKEGMINSKQGASQKPLRTVARKPMIEKEAKTVLTLRTAAFVEEPFSNGMTLDLGDACAFRCCFCHVDNGAREFIPAALTGRKPMGRGRSTKKSTRHIV